MYYNPKSKIIISKSFKTAGSSLYTFIRKNWMLEGCKLDDYHWTLEQCQNHYNEKNFTQLTLIRNPWDYVVSAWFWAMRNGESPVISFQDFLYKDTPFRWRKQKGFWDVRFIDDVIQFEKIQEEIQRLIDEYHLPQPNHPLPHEKRTLNRKEYGYYYEDKDIEYVGEVFKEQIHFFKINFGINYTFN